MATRPLWSGTSLVVHLLSELIERKRYPLELSVSPCRYDSAVMAVAFSRRGQPHAWPGRGHGRPRSPAESTRAVAVGGRRHLSLAAAGCRANRVVGVRQANAVAAHLGRRRDRARRDHRDGGGSGVGATGCTGGNSARRRCTPAPDGWSRSGASRRSRGCRPSTLTAARWTGCSGWPMSPSRRLPRPVRCDIVALDVDVADHLVAQLTDIAAIGAEDAT